MGMVLIPVFYTGRPGVLWFMGSQRVGHDWETELNWTPVLFHIHTPHLQSSHFMFHDMVVIFIHLFPWGTFFRGRGNYMTSFHLLLKILFPSVYHTAWSFPGGARGKEATCQCRKHRRCVFDPQTGNIPWRRSWQPTPVFLPGEAHGRRSLAGYRL